MHGKLVYVDEHHITLPRPENWASIFPALIALKQPAATLWPADTPSNASLKLPLSLKHLTVLENRCLDRVGHDHFLNALSRDPCFKNLYTIDGIGLSQDLIPKLTELRSISTRENELGPILDCHEFLTVSIPNHRSLTHLACKLEIEEY